MPPRKLSDDVVAAPPAARPKEQAPEDAGAGAADERMDPVALAARFAAATDPAERAAVLREIQERLGNREAERIARSAAGPQDA